jgi:hypothetical protein
VCHHTDNKIANAGIYFIIFMTTQQHNGIMAEKMLDEEYKFYHTDLNRWGKTQEKEDQANKNEETVRDEQRQPEQTPRKGEETSCSPTKKSEIRSVVIQVPPKRQKLATGSTAKEIVEGRFFASRAQVYWKITAWEVHSLFSLVLCPFCIKSSQSCDFARRTARRYSQGSVLIRTWRPEYPRH